MSAVGSVPCPVCKWPLTVLAEIRGLQPVEGALSVNVGLSDEAIGHLDAHR